MPDQLMFTVPKEWIPASFYAQAHILLENKSKWLNIRKQTDGSFLYYFLTYEGSKVFKSLYDKDVLLK